jgi:DNA-binding response OmpR family regulator
VLRDLGCTVIVCGFDLEQLDSAELRRRPPNMVVVDAGHAVEMATICRRKLDSLAILADVPSIIAVEVGRLPALDFSVGFDDFVLLPIVPAELYARLRQLDWRMAAFGSEEVIKVGELVIDIAGYEASLRGRQLDFTHQEFELLRFLAANRGRVYSRAQLLDKVWGYEPGAATRTVDIHVRRLRAKLGPVVGGIIETVRNVGYKMRSEAGEESG